MDIIILQCPGLDIRAKCFILISLKNIGFGFFADTLPKLEEGNILLAIFGEL
jgi:hypothetical protein